MNQWSKRRNNDEEATIQRRFIITSQKTRNSSENNEKKRDEKIQKKSVNQIFQKIENMSTMQQNLIMSIYKLESEDVALYAVSSEA